ncbi:hypothetical protein [Actinoplanes sp. NPDC049316]|uniref:hypothetical protein n=1 Tax=Actinoplanes sp. NPDC049316 TaxID=3154727 RepID=UPI003449AABE
MFVPVVIVLAACVGVLLAALESPHAADARVVEWLSRGVVAAGAATATLAVALAVLP